MSALKIGLLIPSCLCVALVTGCEGDRVTEDRAINFSRDGEVVAFQHGEDGIFVANERGGGLSKIFDADETTVAVSSPLWSPVDKQLIFTSARTADTDPRHYNQRLAAWDARPTGRRFPQQDIVYTCMLRPESRVGEAQEPVALFEAACDHPGYVAANLAVRWHPAGDRIVYVDRTSESLHSLFEFDLKTKRRRRILPQEASAILFDWTSGGRYLVCLLADNIENDGAEHADVAGIWIRDGDEGSWWRVPQSSGIHIGGSDALVERLRSKRPAWTHDEKKFAFVVTTSTSDEFARNTLFKVDMTSRDVDKVYESAARIRDLHWHPSGDRLGFVEMGQTARLRVIGQELTGSDIVDHDRVRRFGGWNHTGKRLAYTAPEPSEKRADRWSLLFYPAPGARDQVFVADDKGAGSDVVHAGVRITFPQWSPTRDELSLWGTFAPTHVSLLSAVLPWSLRPGDPAAILDCATGKMHWMAVNDREKAQVGHYYLMRKEYKRAWKWYETRAENGRAAQALRATDLLDFMRSGRVFQDSKIFELHCLTKLGRHDEAAKRLRAFRLAMRFDKEDIEAFASMAGDPGGELQSFVEVITALMQDSYITEVHLSLDAESDGVALFRKELATASTNEERFSRAVCLSQLLLFTRDRAAYATLATETLAPLVMTLYESADSGAESNDPDVQREESWRDQKRATLFGMGGLALLPMMSPEFLGELENEQLRYCLARWKALRANTSDAVERAAIDQFLRATLKRLGDHEQLAELNKRIRSSPPLIDDEPLNTMEQVEGFIRKLRMPMD